VLKEVSVASGRKSIAHVEVTGEVVATFRRAVSGEGLINVLLKKYKLTDVEKGQFCPLEDYLSLLNDLEKRMPTVLRSAGKFISFEALLPPDFQSLEVGLMFLNVAYNMNHRGAQPGEIGQYACEKKSDSLFEMYSSIPYPCTFDEGIFSGFAQKFDETISIEHMDESCRAKGDEYCKYKIELL